MAEARADVQFLFGQYVPRCTHDVDKQFDYHVLQYLDGGAVEVRVGAERHRLEGRWFWSSYPGPRIAFRAAAPHRSWVHRYLAFEGPLVKRWTDAGLFPIRPQATAGEEYGRRFDEVLELSRRTDRWGRLRAALGQDRL